MKNRELFANSGVQLLCFPLEKEVLGHDRWMHLSNGQDSSQAGFEYIQWKILADKLILAVDTTASDDPTDGTGYFCRESALSGDFTVKVPLNAFSDALGEDKLALKGGIDVEFVIKPIGLNEGKPKNVHLVIDFGNNRTGALLLEIQNGVSPSMKMTPFELQDRTNIVSMWDRDNKEQLQPRNRWFSSRTHWCTTPFLSPPKVQRVVHVRKEVERKTSFFSKKPAEPHFETDAIPQPFVPESFLNHSMARMGTEAAELGLKFDAGSEGIKIRTGVSSPKRYLWAADKEWLDDSVWEMFDPDQRHENGYLFRLQGPLLRFFSEDDTEEPEDLKDNHKQSPAKPQYPPRMLMVAAIYELICQAYTFIHTEPYQSKAGDAHRMRQIRTLVLSYPTGMTLLEKQCFQKQAEKACKIFFATVGRQHEKCPSVKLSVDEASAVHFAYLNIEMQKVSMNARLWFSIMSRSSSCSTEQEETPELQSDADQISRRRGRRSVKSEPKVPSKDESKTVRIACIDIGGGTSDLTIAEYTLKGSKGTDTIDGEIIYKNGIGTAGDQLVKRLLECVIVPTIADATGMNQESEDKKFVEFLFGVESPENSMMRFDRVNWMNQVLVPLAEEYLSRAAKQDESDINFEDAGDVIKKLHEQVEALTRVSRYKFVGTSLQLKYKRDEFKAILDDVLGKVVHEFCVKIVDSEVDIVLLAGQPTKLPELQHLIASLLPLHDTRIIPMHRYFAGEKYPYNNDARRIEDPKSTVVVGAAVKFASDQSRLPGLKFRIKDTFQSNSYYWGVYIGREIMEEKVWFEPEGPDEASIRMEEAAYIIGRRHDPSIRAEATPVYVLKAVCPDDESPVDVNVVVRRICAEGDEETLELVSADGKIGDVAAKKNENVFLKLQTLADESYYLDTGALNNIQLDWLDQFVEGEAEDHV